MKPWPALTVGSALLGLVVGLAVVPAATAEEAVDLQAPRGTYAVSSVSPYLVATRWVYTGEVPVLSARVTLTQRSLDDAKATRTVFAGDGRPEIAWKTGTTFTLAYTRSGTFTPVVRLTDSVHNTRDVVLPAIKVRRDTTRPTAGVTTPTRSSRGSSLRVVKGYARDRGTGIAYVRVWVLKGGNGRWWGYDFPTRRWVRTASPGGERRKYTKPLRPAQVRVAANGRWSTPRITPLSRAETLIEVDTRDRGWNDPRGTTSFSLH